MEHGRLAVHRDATIDRIRDRRRTFVDAGDERRFRNDGYLVRPLLSDDQVQRALELHAALVGTDDDRPIRFDSIRPDRSVIGGMTEGLALTWDAVLPGVLERYRVVFSSCVVKDPSEQSGMEAHDDRSYVDERIARSLTLWIPLVDTSPEIGNGHLAVMPHSEHLAPGFGGTNIATWYAPYRGDLAAAMVPVVAPAGTAVVYDSRCVHGSPPNRSAVRRPALVIVVAPQEARLVHAVATSRRGRRLLEVDESFHLHHSPLDLRRHVPDLAGAEPLTDPPIDADPHHVQALLGAASPPIPVADRPRDDRTGPAASPCPRVLRDGAVPDVLAQQVDQVTERLLPAVTAPPAGRTGESDRRTVLVKSGSVGSGLAPELTTAIAPLAPLVEAGLITDMELFVLDPGGSQLRDAPTHPTLLLPLAAPALPAGVATADDVAPFELGLLVGLEPGTPNQVFNDGIDPLPLLELRLGGSR
jgi:hypothetical protein